MGAEAIRDIVAKVDLDVLAKELRTEIFTTKSKQRRKKGGQTSARCGKLPQERQPAGVDGADDLAR